MSDPFETFALAPDSPATNAAAVVPHDVNALAVPSRALWVGSAGDLVVTMLGGQTVTLAGASGLLPIRVRQVRATGTTAAAIVALW